MQHMNTLEILRDAVPFLRLVPDHIYKQLSPDEFLLPDTDIAEARERLEKLLGHYVMTYDRRVFFQDLPAHKHLCGRLKGAQLTTEQTGILFSFEAEYSMKNVSFVAYQKPLELMAVSESPIFKWQRDRIATIMDSKQSE